MAWLYLVVAGLFEVGRPFGLKKGRGPGGALSMLAQQAIPMGTAYASSAASPA